MDPGEPPSIKSLSNQKLAKIRMDLNTGTFRFRQQSRENSKKSIKYQIIGITWIFETLLNRFVQFFSWATNQKVTESILDVADQKLSIYIQFSFIKRSQKILDVFKLGKSFYQCVSSQS